jgi:hypothetical protein
MSVLRPFHFFYMGWEPFLPNNHSKQEEFEDTKGAIRICISSKSEMCKWSIDSSSHRFFLLFTTKLNCNYVFFSLFFFFNIWVPNGLALIDRFYFDTTRLYCNTVFVLQFNFVVKSKKNRWELLSIDHLHISDFDSKIIRFFMFL